MDLLIFLTIQMNKAAMAALEEKWTSTETTSGPLTIKTSHFEIALSEVSPSVSVMVWLILLNFFFTFNQIYLMIDKIVVEIDIDIYCFSGAATAVLSEIVREL